MKAKAQSFDITPNTAYDQGAGVRAAELRLDPSSGEPLEANILVLWADGEVEPVVLVTLDVLYPGRAVREAVERGADPLPPERIFVGASHTHRAPMTDDAKPKLGHADNSYLAWLTAQLEQRVMSALDPTGASTVHLELSATQATHSIHRRRLARFYLGKKLRRNVIALAPDSHGSVDETLLAATVVDHEGKALACIWNYACHPVAHPNPSSYSSHYVHYVREKLRHRFGDELLPVLFFQGFSGDTRPTASVGWRGFRGTVHRLISGQQFRSKMNREKYAAWSASLAETVVEGLATRERVEVANIATRRLVRPGHEFAAGLDREVTFHSVRFADQFALVGVSGEAVSEYAPYVRALTGTRFTMCVGCIDDVFGYIPTATMVAEGGYEGGGFCEPFGLQSIAPGIEAQTKNAFASLLERT